MPKNAFDSLVDVKILNPAFITGFKVLVVYIIYVITFDIYLFVYKTPFLKNTSVWLLLYRVFGLSLPQPPTPIKFLPP